MDESTSNTGAGRERELIDAARREAAELVERPERTLPPPDSVPGFKIINEVGRGGMGVAYKALQLSTKRIVALKVMLAGPFASSSARRRFMREVELAARFQHPGIVRVLESGETASGQLYYAMDFIHGAALNRWLTETQPDIPRTVRLFVELCQAIDYAHGQEVIHRDLKPANVLIDPDGKAHILDFGLSKALDPVDAEDPLTLYVSSPGQVMGTLPYLSPEQAAGRPTDIGPWTDVYALGVMLSEAVNGSLPIDLRGTPSEVIQRIQEGATTPHRMSGTRADRELETIIRKALEKETPRRYQSAADLGADLERYLRHEPLLARRPSRLYLTRKRLFKHRARIGVAVIIVAVIAASLYAAAWSRARSLQRQHARDLAGARRDVSAVQVDSESGRAEYSIGAAQRIRDRFPELPEAHLALAQAQFRAGWEKGGDPGWVDRAIITLRSALQGDSSCGAHHALLAEIYRRTGNLEWRQFETLAARNPADSAESWYVRSFSTLDLSKAVRCAEEVLARDPGHVLARARLARLYEQIGDFDNALRKVSELKAAGADPANYWVFEARILIKQARYHEAISICTEATGRDPHSPVPYRMRAVAHLCLRDYAEAIRVHSKILDIDGADDMWQRYQRATPLWALGRIEEAVADYRAVREWRGQSSYADARLFLILMHQAQELSRQGLLEDSEKLATEGKAVLANARRGLVPESWLEKILACLAGELPPAELVAAADQWDPEQVCEGYYYAGEACLLNGRITEARAWFQACVNTGLVLDPNTVTLDPMNEYHLARWRLDTLVNNE